MERETGIEPATNSLEGCDSTTELLPPSRFALFLFDSSALRRASPPCTLAPRCTLWRVRCLPRGASRWLASQSRAQRARLAKAGGEGRIRTFEAARATDLQSAAFDRFATSPTGLCYGNACVRCFPSGPYLDTRPPPRYLHRFGVTAFSPGSPSRSALSSPVREGWCA